jgi:hypothetical protein
MDVTTMKINVTHSIAILILLTMAACGGGGGGGNKDNTPRGNVVTPPADGEFRPAVSDSTYSNVLVPCITIEAIADACRISRLPFLGQETATPTKADILARTIVSHSWMAVRFGQLLDEMPDDVLKMFRGVTGIAIGAEIRPSYYWAGSGAIYLDPADLWLTAAERNTISKAPDFRGEFSRDLAFSSLWRYVQGNDYAWEYYSLDSAINSRPLSSIVRPMAALLFHELAHANDFIPPARLAAINRQNTPVAQAIDFEEDNISVDLAARAPLNSQMLYGLAEVMYDGVKATTAQRQLSAQTVGLEFELDGANDDYAYASLYEDTAMLFEEVMMKYHFNVDREIAFTDAPFSANAGCEAYVVRWGQRNRIGNPTVMARAEIVVQQLLDLSDTRAYFANVPQPRNLTNGIDWCANLATLARSNSDKSMQKTSRHTLRPTDLKRANNRSHNPFQPLK